MDAASDVTVDVDMSAAKAAAVVTLDATLVPHDASATEDSAAPQGEEIEFTIVFGKQNTRVKRRADSTVLQLKEEAERQIGIAVKGQKLLCAGKALKDDSTLKQVGIKNGAKVLLLGSLPTAVEAISQQPKDEAAAKWDSDAPQDQAVCKQAPHLKVLEKGLPEEALASIKDKQVPLPKEILCIPGLLNSQAVKVRLTFKDEMQQLWIGSATATQKVPYSTVSKIEAHPIEGKEEYSIIALHLGSGSSSKYWLYYFPSQYVAGLKIKLLGLESLL